MTIIQQLQTTLVETGYFDSDRSLRAVCGLDQRVYQWRKVLPEAGNQIERVLKTAAFLIDQRHHETRENGLICLVQVFRDSVDEEDMLHRHLSALLTMLPDELDTLRTQLSLSSGQVIPLQRPPRAEYFTDRERELATILEQLQPGQTVTLCGPGCMGKTALAAEAIWTLAPQRTPPTRFPDGLIWHSFYTKPRTDQALRYIVLSLGGEIEGDLEAATQRVLGGKQLLLLLDGTEEADDLRRFKQLTANCGVIITSRLRADAFDTRQRQDIPPLPQAEAVALLRAFVPAAELTTLTEICDMLGGLPLAVGLVGRYLTETGEYPSCTKEFGSVGRRKMTKLRSEI